MTNKTELKNIKCPHCGASYYSVNYRVTTCIGWTPVYKDGVQVNKNPNKVSVNCTCCNCGKEFSYTEGDEEKSSILTEHDGTINEPEEVTVDEKELTYEEALDILLSQVDLVSLENMMCKDALEEAIERLRKYEKDYANELVDEFMSKTVITGTARRSTEPPITCPICPHCNGHHTEQLYGSANLTVDRSDLDLHYKCLDCGKEFDKKL